MAARITLESALLDIITESDAINANTCEDRFASRNKLWRRARWIFDNAIDVRVERANNEQKGYAEKDIGFPTIPMRTKAETGERQTADYVFYWKFKFEDESAFRKMGICFERKEVKDFHGTIISNYERFDREIDRFLQDPKTKMMFILIEGSLAEALAYLPPKRYAGDQVKHMIASKLGAIAGIEARGVHISFRGSRLASANSMKGYATHFFEKNIEFILRDEIKEIKANGITERYKQPIKAVPGTADKPAGTTGVTAKKRNPVQSSGTVRKKRKTTKK